MSLQTDLQGDFDTMLADLGITTTIGSDSVSAVRSTLDKDVAYSEMLNKVVEYKFTLWYALDDLTAAGHSTIGVHDQIVVGSTTYLVAKRSDDPVFALVALDMVEQYG